MYKRQVYIFKLKISSENRYDEVNEKDSYTTIVKFRMPKSIRQQIRNIRSNTSQMVYGRLIRFEEGIYIGTDREIREVKPIVEKADREIRNIPEKTIELLKEKIAEEKDSKKIFSMKKEIEEIEKNKEKIREELFVRLRLLPLDEQAIQKGELYTAMVHAIYTKLIESTLKRLKQIKSPQLSDRSIETMNKLLDKIAALNFLEDEEVQRKIEVLRKKIFNEDLIQLREELQRELESLKRKETMFAYLEI